MTRDASVLIVGLGPVGATLALLLGRAGVATVVVEREPAVFALPRAVALDDEALRVLQAAGLDGYDHLPLLADHGVRLLSAAGAPLVEIPPRRSSNGHPQVAFFQQPDLERYLRSALVRQPTVEVLLEHEMRRLAHEQDGVRVTVRDRRTGTTRDLWTEWVVGCDGAAGGVRRALGIRLRGFTSRRRWLVVDTRMRRSVARAPFEFICDPARPTVSAPLPGGLHRWEFMLLPNEDHNPGDLAEYARALVTRCTDVDDFEVLRTSVYRFHARVAESWSDGRVFLAGDAAHLSPPFAGLGLSSGLRDAHNLAWKLAAVVGGRSSTRLLGSYESERRPDAVRLIARAVALGGLVQTTQRPIAAVRDAALRTANRPPLVQRWVAAGGWKPRTTYRRGFLHPRTRRRAGEGSQIPQPAVRLPNGKQEAFDDVLGGAFSLVGWRTDPRLGLDTASSRVIEAFGVRIMRLEPDLAPLSESLEVVVIADADGVLERWFRAAGASLALVRPDHYVYAVFETSEAPSVLREFSCAMGAA